MKHNTRMASGIACSGLLLAMSMGLAHSQEPTGPDYLVDNNAVPEEVQAQFATICLRMIGPWGPNSPMRYMASDPRGRKVIAFCWGGFPNSIDNVGAERALQYLPYMDMAFMLQQQPTATGTVWTPWVEINAINLSSADLYRDFDDFNPSRQAAGRDDASTAKEQFVSAVTRLEDEGWNCAFEDEERHHGEGKHWDHIHDRLFAACLGPEMPVNP